MKVYDKIKELDRVIKEIEIGSVAFSTWHEPPDCKVIMYNLDIGVPKLTDSLIKLKTRFKAEYLRHLRKYRKELLKELQKEITSKVL